MPTRAPAASSSVPRSSARRASRASGAPKPAPLAPIERVEGTYGAIGGKIKVFHRNDSGWTLGAVKAADGVPLKVVGVIADEDLHGHTVFTGVVERDRSRGELQFRILGTADPAMPESSLRSYLASGLVWHVGEATADAIITHFGAQTMDVLLREPARLIEVKGIGEGMLAGITSSLARTLHVAPVVGLLHPHPFGVAVGTCQAIAKRYGAAAVSLIQEDPYRLAREIRGVSFAEADRIAIGLGHDPADPARLRAALRHVVSAIIREEGHTVVPHTRVVGDTAELLRLESGNAPVIAALVEMIAAGDLVSIKEPSGVSAPEIAEAEALLVEVFRGLLSRSPAFAALSSDADVADLEARSGITFDPTQRAALEGILARGLTVLTGGPGTGKTTMVRAICDLADDADLSVALMSFTGKAAKRLAEATGREASTIHRYLRFVPGNAGTPGTFLGPDWPSDVVIVDEVSMLDVPLAAELVKHLGPGARLILVGDVDQLPAIGPGAILSDLIEAGSVPVFRLEVIHRTEDATGIPDLAKAINDGSHALPFNDTKTRLTERGSGEDIATWIGNHFRRYADRVEEFQVLAPMKKGPAGVDNLNGVISRAVRGARSEARSDGRSEGGRATGSMSGVVTGLGGASIHRDSFNMRAGDRIIWLNNDKDLDLFNGEIGELVEVRSNGSAVVSFNDRPRIEVPKEKVQADAFSLAYALTIHKAQGSQFPIVIVVMDTSAHVMLERRLLYTAVSRAENAVAIIGQRIAVLRAIDRHETKKRVTALGPGLHAAGLSNEAQQS